MDNDGYRIVLFNKHCQYCKHWECKENEYPCNECLGDPINLYSDKPTYFEEKEESATK